MTITKDMNGSACTLAITGRIDTLTSAELEQAMLNCIDTCDTLCFDMTGVDYVSSVGIRVSTLPRQHVAAKQTFVCKLHKSAARHYNISLKMRFFSRHPGGFIV